MSEKMPREIYVGYVMDRRTGKLHNVLEVCENSWRSSSTNCITSTSVVWTRMNTTSTDWFVILVK